MLYVSVIFLVAIFCIGASLTPSQKKELVEAEHRLEEAVEILVHNQPYPDQGKQDKKESIRSSPNEKGKTNSKKLESLPSPRNEHLAEKPSDASEKDNKKDDHQSNRVSADGAIAGMEEPSTRWVDDEKKLKKNLQVLYDIQAKRESLGVPVLTRYLGEDIPAFVGTPLSTMKEEEWKKLVDAKYEEMRKEEEEWQKKMTLLMEEQSKNRRDMGITTA